MNFIYFLAIMIFVWGGFETSNAHASVIANKTFFTAHKFDRIFFASDNTFSQQLEENWGNTTAGHIIQGRWKFNKSTSKICLIYISPISRKYCYNFVRNNKTAGYYATDDNNSIHFFWEETKHGNWLLSPEGIHLLKKAYNGEEIEGNDEIDKEIYNYLINKTIKLPNDDHFIFKEENEGVFFNKNPSSSVDFQWNIHNLNTTLTIGDSNKTYLATIGDEFLDKKDKKIYLYLRKDIFHEPGNGLFSVMQAGKNSPEN